MLPTITHFHKRKETGMEEQAAHSLKSRLISCPGIPFSMNDTRHPFSRAFYGRSIHDLLTTNWFLNLEIIEAQREKKKIDFSYASDVFDQHYSKNGTNMKHTYMLNLKTNENNLMPSGTLTCVMRFQDNTVFTRSWQLV